MIYTVTCWPFGVGETDGGNVGEPEVFDSLHKAVLRGIEEVSEWLHSTLDPRNGGAPASYTRDMGMNVALEIARACNLSLRGDEFLPLRICGPMSNDVVVIERAR